MRSKTLFFTLMLFSGIVVGTLVGNVTRGVEFLSWLSYGIDFGMKAPVNLELGVLSLTFGFSINLTISCIIFIIIAMLVGRKVVRGR